jgi:predicted transcriptional regulator of viral defense system
MIGHEEKIIRLLRRSGVLRSRELAEHDIPRQYLSILQERAMIQRSGRGLYILADANVTEQHSIAEAAKKVPAGVVCLLSALRLHGLTTQAPFEVWMAIDFKAWKPRIDYPPMRIVRFSGKALSEGVQMRKIEGVEVRLYSPAKTVADCFKYRNKIGLDVALEALRDCRRKRKATIDEIWSAAKVCRVAKVMQPYMESLA